MFSKVSLILTTIITYGCGEDSNESRARLGLVSIEIESEKEFVSSGEVFDVTAIGTYENGETENVTNIVDWQFSNDSVISLSEKGGFVGEQLGDTSIQAVSHSVESDILEVRVYNELAEENIYLIANELVLSGQPSGNVSGQMQGKDLLGSEIWFEVLTFPEFGSLDYDTTTGAFDYTNFESTDYDSFSFVIRNNKYVSMPSTVHIGVSPYDVEQLHGDINDGKKLNLVLIGDGFTNDDMYIFEEYAKSTTEFMFDYGDAMINQAPAWNVFSISAVSNESGVSYDDASPEDGGQVVDNLFGSQMWCYGIERMLCERSTNEVRDVVREAIPNFDAIILIANTHHMAGSSPLRSNFGISSTGNTEKFWEVEITQEMMIHEFGHGFYGLHDEYYYSPYSNAPDTEPRERNITIDNNPDTSKWSMWVGELLEDGEIVDFYEGGKANIEKGLWRPTPESVMGVYGTTFYPVNREAWLLKVYEYAGLVRSYYPKNVDAVIPTDEKVVFDIQPIIESNVSTKWYIDGVHQENHDNEMNFEASITHGVVEVKVDDKTGWIRHDPDEFSHQSITWTVCKDLESCN